MIAPGMLVTGGLPALIAVGVGETSAEEQQ